MAKRRILKKSIGYLAGDLFTEVWVRTWLLPAVEKEKAEKLMTRILDMQADFVSRAHRPDGKDNKALVKAYYRKLRADLQTEADAIVSEIETLNQEKTA